MPDVVTCILLHQGRLLLLKRSDRVSTYRGLWAGVSGYVEEGDDPLERAYIEIEEETGLTREQMVLERGAPPVEFYDPGEGRRWRVHPFLFRALTAEVSIDWEHDDYAWVAPEELDRYPTVPKLAETVRRLLPSPS
ncbi:MAG: NUDIX domain-containing protein [Thermoplasmatota archaeon]